MSNMSTVGPELPAHLLAKRKRQAEDEKEGTSVIQSQSRAHSHSSPGSDGGEKRRRVIGPSLPPASLEERPSADPANDGNDSSSDDDFGPALPARRVSQVRCIKYQGRSI